MDATAPAGFVEQFHLLFLSFRLFRQSEFGQTAIRVAADLHPVAHWLLAAPARHRRSAPGGVT